MNNCQNLIRFWNPDKHIWKGKRVFLGFEVSIDNEHYYLFIGKNGRNNGNRKIPLYCELAMPQGASGRIMQSLGERYEELHGILPESLQSEKNTSYIFKSFDEGEYEKACRCIKAMLMAIH